MMHVGPKLKYIWSRIIGARTQGRLIAPNEHRDPDYQPGPAVVYVMLLGSGLCGGNSTPTSTYRWTCGRLFRAVRIKQHQQASVRHNRIYCCCW